MKMTYEELFQTLNPIDTDHRKYTMHHDYIIEEAKKQSLKEISRSDCAAILHELQTNSEMIYAVACYQWLLTNSAYDFATTRAKFIDYDLIRGVKNYINSHVRAMIHLVN